MKIARILFVLASSVGLISLVSCGQDVCIAGIGSCGAYKKALDNNKDLQTSTGQGGAPTGRLAIGCKSWSGQCFTDSGRSLEFVASGGTPPYKFNVISGGGNFPGNGGGSVAAGSEKILNLSVLSVTTNVMNRIRVRVTDATNQAINAPCDMCEVDAVILPLK